MANSAQEYIDKLYNQSQGVAGQLHEQRKQSDDEVIQQINAAIDRATASSTNPYKTQMEQLPSQYQSLFDANAVQELVGRRQVQEAMANMGLTDSGLNRTQQTALSVQRGNADASVRLAQQQKRPRSSRTRYPSLWRTRRHKNSSRRRLSARIHPTGTIPCCRISTARPSSREPACTTRSRNGRPPRPRRKDKGKRRLRHRKKLLEKKCYRSCRKKGIRLSNSRRSQKLPRKYGQ